MKGDFWTGKVYCTLKCLYYRGRILPKRINVRVEHVKHSNCRLDFLKRRKENDEKRKEAKEKGIKVKCKREVSWFLFPEKKKHLVERGTKRMKIFVHIFSLEMCEMSLKAVQHL